MKKRLMCFVFLFCSLVLYTQNREIDSLRKGINVGKQDTNQVNLLINLSKQFFLIADYRMALKYSGSALDIAEKLNFKNAIAKAANLKGIIIMYQGNYPEALKSHFFALKIREEMGDKKGIASSYNNIGDIYRLQGNYSGALIKHNAALELRKEIGDKQGIADSYNNIGAVYEQKGEYVLAEENQILSLKIKEEINDKSGMATSYINIGVVNDLQGKYSKAIESYLIALKIKKELNDNLGICYILENLCFTYINLKKYKQAEKFCLEGLSLAKKIGALELVAKGNKMLYTIYAETNECSKSLKSYMDYIAARDSLFNEENTKKTVRLEMNFEFEKKEAAAKLEQEKKEAVTAAESKKQKVIIYSVCGILLLVLAFAVFAYRSYLQKRKANIEITKQKQVIEEKQKEILDSIRYAKRIQSTLLPSEKFITNNIKRLNKR